jgi:YebC/PmpR family DNA-binding regulatory protein
MSGHSHSKKIKHAKELTDQKRGQMFSKMARVIWLAVKEGGINPETNSKLKIAIEKAKGFNLPRENIERAIKQATGGGEEANLEEVLYEAYGPGGIALIIEGITDNKNRTLGEIKQILSQNNGKLVGEGAVRWLFEKRGVITVIFASQPSFIKSKEELELAVIEAGAEDIRWYGDDLEIYTTPENLEKIKKILEEKLVKIDSFSLDWVAKETVDLDEKQKEACQKLFEALDENEAVQEIYSNLKI